MDDNTHPFLTPRIYRFDYLGLKTGRVLIERLLSEELGPPSPREVLDVGCGSAPWKPLFSPYLGTYTGLDVQEGPQVDLVASAVAIPLPDESRDVIVSISALEHIANYRAVVAEMHRILRPGGVALVGMPFLWEVHGHPHDYWRFAPSGFEAVFSQFASCHVHQAGGPWTNFLQIQNLYLRHLQERWPAWRGLVAPFITLNNILGAMRLHSRCSTAMATFYIAVARK